MFNRFLTVMVLLAAAAAPAAAVEGGWAAHDVPDWDVGAERPSAGPVGQGSFMAGLAFDAAPVQGASPALSAGAYYYRLHGGPGADAAAGAYTLSAILTAVPEPHGLALMLGGLLVVGAHSARRARASA